MGPQPVYRSLDELLQGKLFRIPSYQRAYSWEIRQREDLFDDICKVVDSGNDHFMATIVCRRDPKKHLVGSDRLYEYDVVDGQQRLTTLIALLKAIEKQLAADSSDHRREAEKLQELLVKPSGRMLLLQTNHDEAGIFGEFLEQGRIPSNEKLHTVAEKNLRDLFVDVEHFVTKQWVEKTQHSTIQLLSIVKNQLGFVFYEVEDESIVYTVFEVLNSRGMEVSWLDKAKSILMGVAFSQSRHDGGTEERIDHLRQHWAAIYKEIGIKEIRDFEILNFTSTFLLTEDREKGRVLSSQDALDLVRQLAHEDSRNVSEIAKTFERVAKVLRKVTEKPALDWPTSISQARLFYTAVQLNPEISEPDRDKILDIWERVTFRIYGMLGKDSRKNVGDFVRLARGLFSSKIKNPFDEQSQAAEYRKFESMSLADKVIACLKKIGDEAAPIADALENLKDTDCYSDWVDELKYFFYRIEGEIARRKKGRPSADQWNKILESSGDDTVEHIFPQEDPQRKWAGKMGSGKNTIRSNVHRLGNLMILPREMNAQCGTKSFSEKKVIYKNSMLFSASDVIFDDYLIGDARTERQDWTRDEINKREARLLELAKEIWGT